MVAERNKKIGEKAVGEEKSVHEGSEALIKVPDAIQMTQDTLRDKELSEQEKQDLKHFESAIENNLGSFLEVGAALLRIKDERLYRETYSTFEEYCRRKWDISKARSYQLISAKQIQINLSTTVDKPISFNEAMLRPLAGHPPDFQKEGWSRALRKAHGGKVTSQHTRQAVKELFPKEAAKKADGKVSPDFKTAFIRLEAEIDKAKKENWATTSKEEALRYIALLRKEITANSDN